MDGTYSGLPLYLAEAIKREAQEHKMDRQLHSDDECEDGDSVRGTNQPPSGKKTKGRVKIKMEFIDNKLRRYTTFSKRKTGIMKKAYELSTLTGTQVMLLVASETGHVYTFATKKLQPMITSEAGKALIQTCLNSPDDTTAQGDGDQRMCATGYEETDLNYACSEAEDDLEQNRDGDIDDPGSEEGSNDCFYDHPSHSSDLVKKRAPVSLPPSAHLSAPSNSLAARNQPALANPPQYTGPSPAHLFTTTTTTSTSLTTSSQSSIYFPVSAANLLSSLAAQSVSLSGRPVSTGATTITTIPPGTNLVRNAPNNSSCSLALSSLPPGVLAQLGGVHQSVSAAASRTSSVEKPIILIRPPSLTSAPSNSDQLLKISHLLPKEPLPLHSSDLLRIEKRPGQEHNTSSDSPENLSLPKRSRDT